MSFMNVMFIKFTFFINQYIINILVLATIVELVQVYV